MMSNAAHEVLLSLADDELCMGQQHAAWIGVTPYLEEDLAFISIAQDELAHARALLALLVADGATVPGHAIPDGTAGADGGDDPERTVDRLAMGRAPHEHRCCALVEEPCTAWEDAFVRHLLYDEAEALRWEALATSSEPTVAALARRVLVEEEYHRGHARPLLRRLLAGTDESRARITAALARLLPLARSLFEPTLDEAVAVRDGVTASSAAQLEQAWRARLVEAGVPEPVVRALPLRPPGAGGRCGVRSPHFAALHAEMGAVWVLDPQARW